ncbi:MAG: type II secretion system F family protein [Betaproteobacteria bacterium]|nr:type II secretion system F family protein [Betaproteobacteria bacterium]
MPGFSYKARNNRGEQLTGRLEAASADATAEELMRTGLIPIEIRPEAAAKPPLLLRFSEEKVEATDIMLFARQMASLLRAGVPILRALGSLAESTPHKRFQAVLNDVREGLSAGREMSACLRKHPTVFEPLFINMVRVGESTGRLDDVFLRLFHHLEFEREMRERVKGALRYPTFVVIALMAALAVINVLVIPAFAKVYKSAHADLPIFTRVLIGMSEWTVTWWPLLLGGLIAAVLGVRAWKRTAEGRYQWDKWMLRIPIIGAVLNKATMARFAKGLAMAYQSGVPIVQGLTHTAQVVGNAFVASRVEQMRDGVERGESLSRTARASGVFSPIVLQMMSVGEETGELDRLLNEIGDLYQRDVEYQIRNLSQQIEPILIAGLGFIIVTVALGVFLPVWDMGSHMMKR